jgi:hypothetical protein
VSTNNMAEQLREATMLATELAIGETRKVATTLFAEGHLLRFLVSLNDREVFPAPRLIPDLGQLVALVPRQRGGRVLINDGWLSGDDYDRVWRRGRHLLLHHLGDWSGAVVAVRMGDTITVPSLIPRTWKVTEGGIEAL